MAKKPIAIDRDRTQIRWARRKMENADYQPTIMMMTLENNVLLISSSEQHKNPESTLKPCKNKTEKKIISE